MLESGHYGLFWHAAIPAQTLPLELSTEADKLDTNLLWQSKVLSVLQDLLHCIIEAGVPDTRTVQPREQVTDEAEEEGNVLKDKLGQVHVSKGPHQHHVLHRKRKGGIQQ